MSVFQDDIEKSLREYPDDSFDYVILNQSMQEVRKVDCVIGDALRISTKVIVGFPNFAYFKSRFALFPRKISGDKIAALSLVRYAQCAF